MWKTDSSDSTNSRIVTDVMAVFHRLKMERQGYEPIWKDITDYLYPRRAGWDYNPADIQSFGDMIFDGSAITAHNKLADGIFGELCSPSIDWLELEPKRREDRENKGLMSYLKDLEMALYEVFARSNFYDSIAEDMHDCSALGTSVVYVEDAPELGRPVYTPLHLREVYISEDRYGAVDTLYRDFEMTRRQVMEKFHDSPDLPEDFKKEAIKDPESRVRILHAQFPRNVAISEDGPIEKGSKKYASIYILQSKSPVGAALIAPLGGTMLENGGTDYRHFEAWRFAKSSGEVYGRSPAMDAIYDIKMINLQSKTMADVAQLAARPPMQAPESLRGKIKIAPKAITYRVGDERVEPIITSLSYPLGLDSMERREKIIREHFKTDFFMAISQLQGTARQRTATEIMELKAEAAAILGSVIGRIQSERIDPIVMQTIAIEAAAGRLPKHPAGLSGGIQFKVNYVGPLAQAQRRYLRVQGLNQGLSAALQYAQIDPMIQYNFDMNGAAREIATANGFPYRFLRSQADTDKIINGIRQQQAAAAEAEQQRLNMQAGASAAKAPEPGSPLERDMQAEAQMTKAGANVVRPGAVR
jgi:hypothetical protein